MKMDTGVGLMLCLTLLLTACQPIRASEPLPPAPLLSTHEQRNMAIVQNYYQELARGNIAIVLDVYADEYTRHSAGQVGQTSRQQAYVEQSALKRSLPDLHVEIDAMFAHGDLVVTEMAWTTTLHGDFLGMPTTSPRSHHRGLIVRRLQAGKVVEEWDLFDNLSLLQSLDYLPTWEEIIVQGPTDVPTRPPAPSAAVLRLNQAGLTNQERWHRQLVQQLYEAYANGHPDVVDAIYAKHIKAHQSGQMSLIPSTQLQRELVTIKQANPDLQALVHSLFVQGELVVVELTWIGTHTGTYADIPATGHTIVRDGLVIYRLDEHKIVESWEIWDNLGFLQSVGYLPSLRTIIAQRPRKGTHARIQLVDSDRLDESGTYPYGVIRQHFRYPLF